MTSSFLHPRCFCLVCVIPAKKTDDGKSIIKITPFIKSPQAIIYQLSHCHSTQYICYKKNLFYCCYLCVVFYLFCVKQSSSHLFSFAFKQSIIIHMCMHTHGCQMMVIGTSKTTNFLNNFFYNIFLYWIATPVIGVMFFYRQIFSGGSTI